VPPSVSTETSGRRTTEQSPTSTSSAEYLVSQIKSHKRGAAITLAALVIAAAGLAYFSYFKHRRAPLTEQDTILIADFVNTTGDAVLDGTLKTALAVQLEQSPFLNLFSDERVRDVALHGTLARRARDERDRARDLPTSGTKALAGTVSI
jgi:hypothetical protein